jgi:hypothetical protein
VIDLGTVTEASVLIIQGNAAGHHFTVESYDSTGGYLDLLVNAAAPYEGIRPLNFGPEPHAGRLVISAIDPWKIIVSAARHSILDDRRLLLPAEYAGNRDDVLFFQSSPGEAVITGNAEGRHFGIIGHNGGWQLLVNTIEPYSGTVGLHPDTWALEVRATGSWSASITEGR